MKTNIKKPRSALYNRATVGDVILYIVMILFMACIIVPFLHVIAVSFSAKGPVIRGEVSIYPIGFTLETYRGVLSDGKFFRAYGNTIFYTVVGTTISLMTTAMAAYALSRKKIVGHKLFSIMITITMFFGGGMVPTYLTVSKLGLVDTRWAMLLPGMISTWNLIVMRSFFVAYPQEIIESGMIDGLRDPGVFLRLVLPTSKAALATIALYYAVGYWNAYMNARIYLQKQELYPVMHLLQQMIASVTNENTGSDEHQLVAATIRYCCIMIVVTPIMCVYPYLQKYFVKGVMVGSIKG